MLTPRKENLPDGRLSIVMNRVTVFIHSDTEFTNVILNRLKATLGQTPMIRCEPFKVAPKQIDHSQFFSLLTHQGRTFPVSHALAQVLPFLPGVGFINGCLAAQFTHKDKKVTVYLKNPPLIGVQANHGRWKAMLGSKYLGTFDTREEAAYNHDLAALQSSGPLNFPLYPYPAFLRTYQALTPLDKQLQKMHNL